ncbi:unnamed protein product [Adineta ricciae]|uniref:Uncharacterized protein n=1 Tax=Adineta ricciae TaxID=249248 RepID=A0A814Q2J1_ADIRI|nr:unnamed protein product [Adineta ricciae]
MNMLRRLHTASILLGGTDGTASTHFEMYDPVSGNWTVTGDLTKRRYEYTRSSLQNGSVIVAGQMKRYAHTATVLPNGKVMVTGGDDYTGNPSTGNLTIITRESISIQSIEKLKDNGANRGCFSLLHSLWFIDEISCTCGQPVEDFHILSHSPLPVNLDDEHQELGKITAILNVTNSDIVFCQKNLQSLGIRDIFFVNGIVSNALSNPQQLYSITISDTPTPTPSRWYESIHFANRRIPQYRCITT